MPDKIVRSRRSASKPKPWFARAWKPPAVAIPGNGPRCSRFCRAWKRIPRSKRSIGPCGAGCRGSAWRPCTTRSRRWSAQLAARLTSNDGRSRYDCRSEDHYHLRDVETGEIRDLAVGFDPDLLAKLDPALTEKLAGAGFEVLGYRLEVLGRFGK